eukprot:TRINITY_DN26121_c0_g1_i2.p1 TRINITY_DN26121_c0_g1~~TRINITY_DN26121_c0_g1_i2.p1  ORF type:complete len:406 (-),score=47.25 TRINITY_DN26121_c0_g1_i2:70-1260(-)
MAPDAAFASFTGGQPRSAAPCCLLATLLRGACQRPSYVHQAAAHHVLTHSSHGKCYVKLAGLMATTAGIGVTAFREAARCRGKAASLWSRRRVSCFCLDAGNRLENLQKTTFSASDGAVLKISGGPPASSTKTKGQTLVFIHGSFHAAWCWEPHFISYFQSQGFETYALSLRGHGGSSMGNTEQGTVEMHAKDIADFVEHLHSKEGQPVVVVGHSFGGLFVQKAASDLVQKRPGVLSGIVLLSSVPPSGNSGLGARYFQRDFFLGARITWGMVTRAFEQDLQLSREMFFDADMPSEKVKAYTQAMGNGCPSGTRLLDLSKLPRSLPVAVVKPGKLPVLVIGGDKDVIVDREALEETAMAHGLASPVILEGVAHDAMLDTQWRKAADEIFSWLAELR